MASASWEDHKGRVGVLHLEGDQVPVFVHCSVGGMWSTIPPQCWSGEHSEDTDGENVASSLCLRY